MITHNNAVGRMPGLILLLALILLNCYGSTAQLCPPTPDDCLQPFHISFTDGPSVQRCPMLGYSFSGIVTPTTSTGTFSVPLVTVAYDPAPTPAASPALLSDAPPPAHDPVYFAGVTNVGAISWYQNSIGYPYASSGLFFNSGPDFFGPYPGGVWNMGTNITTDWIPRSYTYSAFGGFGPNLIQNGDFQATGSSLYQCFTTQYHDFTGSSGNTPGHIKVGSWGGTGAPCLSLGPINMGDSYDEALDVFTHSGTSCFTCPDRMLNVRGAVDRCHRHWAFSITEGWHWECDNGVMQPGYFWGQNVKLCEGQWYRFCYWVRLMARCSDASELPRIRVAMLPFGNPSTAAENNYAEPTGSTLDERVVGVVTPAGQCDANWQKVEIRFKATSSGPSFFFMTDENESGHGNAFSIDDIQLNRLAYDTATIRIAPLPAVFPTLTSDVACNNQPCYFYGHGTPGDQVGYKIQVGTGSWGPLQYATVSAAGTYTCTAGGPYAAGTMITAKVVSLKLASCPNFAPLPPAGVAVRVAMTIAAPVPAVLSWHPSTFCNTGEVFNIHGVSPSHMTGAPGFYVWNWSTSNPSALSISSGIGLEDKNFTTGAGTPYSGCENVTISLQINNFCGSTVPTTTTVNVCHNWANVVTTPYPTCPGWPTTYNVHSSPGDIVDWTISTSNPFPPTYSGTNVIPAAPGNFFDETTIANAPPGTNEITLDNIQVGSCSYSLTPTAMMVFPKPMGGTISGPSDICQGDMETYHFNPYGGWPYCAEVWSSSTPWMFSMFGMSPYNWVTGIAPGTGQLVLTQANICGSVTLTKNVTVHHPWANFSQSTTCWPAIPGSIVTYSVNAGPIGTVIRYQDNTGAIGTHTMTTIPWIYTQTATVPYTNFSILDATEGGCTVDISYGMAIPTQPFLPVFKGNRNICVGATSTLSMSSAGAPISSCGGSPVFTWSSGNPAVATVDATTGVVLGISSGTALITCTTFCGCVGITTVNVIVPPPCVCSYQDGGIAFGVLDPGNTGELDASGGPYTGNYVLTHSIVVNSSVDLTNCVIVVADGVQITVNSGGKLTIKGSHLFCCGTDMWQGIKLSTDLAGGGMGPTGQLVFGATKTASSLIEDAYIAIDIPSPTEMPNYLSTQASSSTADLTLLCDGVIFNRNVSGIRISDYHSMIDPLPGEPTSLHPGYPFVVKNSIFTSRKMSSYSPLASGWSTITMWPFVWPATNAIGTVPGLKTPWGAGPYDAPYTIDNPTAYATGGFSPSPCHNGLKARYGVELHQVQMVDFAGAPLGKFSNVVLGGDATAPMGRNEDMNLYDHLSYGIYAQNSNVTSRNSAFMHISGTIGNEGTGIYSFIVGPSYDMCKLDVFGTPASAAMPGTSFYNNKFYDCVNGIVSDGLNTVRSIYSEIYSAHSSLTPPIFATNAGNFGIKISASNIYKVFVNYNKIVNVSYGISMIQTAPPPGVVAYMGYVEVNRNSMGATWPMGSPITSGEYMVHGINVQTLFTPAWWEFLTNCDVDIVLNNMNNVFNGITLTGYDFDYNIKTTFGNDIRLVEDNLTGTASSVPQAGIYHANNYRDHISGNSVTGPGYNIPTPPAPFYQAPIIEAYHLQNNDGSICINRASETGTGYFFSGYCHLGWTDNVMDKNSFGFVLNGMLGPQPSGTFYMASTNKTNNRWTPAGWWTGDRYQTYVLPDPYAYFTSIASPMTVDANVLEDPTNNYGDPSSTTVDWYGFGPSGSGNGLWPVAGLAGEVCNSIGVMPSDFSSGSRHATSGGVEPDRGSNAADAHFVAQMRAWKTLRKRKGPDTSATDAAFRRMAGKSRYELLASIEESVANGDYNTADQLLAMPDDSIVSHGVDLATGVAMADAGGDRIVSNYRSYFKLLVKMQQKGLVATDTAVVDALAEKCALSDGDVVHKARALYNLLHNTNRHFSDLCERHSMPETVNKTAATQQYTMAPNPNSGEMVIQQALPYAGEVPVEIINATGITCYWAKLHFEEGRLRLNVKELTPGVYIMKLFDENNGTFVIRFCKL